MAADGDYHINSGNNIDYTMLLNGVHLGDPELSAAATKSSYIGIDPEMVALANEYGRSNYRIAKNYNVGTIEAENDMNEVLKKKRDELLTKAVTASVENFDSVYDEYMEDYLSSGGQEIIDERIEKLERFYGIKYEK